MRCERRMFLGVLSGSLAASAWGRWPTVASAESTPTLEPRPDEGLFAYLTRRDGAVDAAASKRLLGAANPFKEGDAIVGVAAKDDAERELARTLLARTTLAELDRHPPLVDDTYRALTENLDRTAQQRVSGWTLRELKAFLLEQPEAMIKPIMPGLSSDVIGCVVKLLSNDELTRVGAKLFNPLPGSRIGARGYLGARIQPNSPTDHLDDIRWQVFNGFAYAVGDVVLGNNPVSSDPVSVRAIERTLLDILQTFALTDILPHCVLAHIDVQAEVERLDPGSTFLWFQSLAGSDTANATFDLTLEKLTSYAKSRSGPFGLYFETGQGADFTNGHGHGFDMVLHESRKYGLARLMSRYVADARRAAGHSGEPWVHVNDVAGFIGPEVFRTKEQLVRCCLEDIVMGKLHGLCLGLDVCTTLHMDVSLDDLDWCLEQLAPACPAYLMALPTKIDPMLGYLTTGYQDHVRLREKFGGRVNDPMWRFFQQLGVIDEQGQPTKHFGDPNWVYLQYRRRRGDERADDIILAEGRKTMAEIRGRGLFLAEGHGERPSDLAPDLQRDIRRIYDDSKASLWAEWNPELPTRLADSLPLSTRSADRTDYILHPTSGERLSPAAEDAVLALRQRHGGRYNVQLILSDGLNPVATGDLEQVRPFLERLRANLATAEYQVSPELCLITSGRVRAGYQLGQLLFAGLAGPRAVLHIIGERPGSGHHTFSVYMTAPDGAIWGTPGRVDHDLTRVIAGIAATALAPRQGADDTVKILNRLWGQA